jgi:hypothetical protein
MGKKSGSGSEMKNPDHISESLKNNFGLKYLTSLMWIRDPGWEKFGSGIRDRKNSDPVSWVNILDQQRWIFVI